MVKLSEKLIELRKTNQMTQEELAAICSVSRQSVSKWESGVMLPEVDKLLVLGEALHVSMDVLLKDELMVDGVQKGHGCGGNVGQEKKTEIYEGVLIKESISDENIIDCLNIHKVELWSTDGEPKYWTALFFTCPNKDFPERISKAMLSDSGRVGTWFVDFKAGNKKYIVFKDKILKYQIGNQAEKEAVCAECRKMGILDRQMNWPE